MANRSYLYACNEVPGTNDSPEKNLVGLSECNYAIPLTYKILASANPRICRSRIWNTDEPIAIVGEFDAGVAALTQFLNNITLDEAQPQIEQALAFLKKPENKAEYILLESGEIFELGGSELGAQNISLLEDINNLDASMEHMLNNINPLKASTPAKLFGLFARKSQHPTQANESLRTLEELALKNWSNILYFDLS